MLNSAGRKMYSAHLAPLAAGGAMYTFHTFEENMLKDLQPPEKSGLQYKCLVLIL